MNLANPTPLRLGAKGTLGETDYEVIGRLVKGMTEGDEIYYWHKFLLLSLDGRQAFLEFEEEEGLVEWKLMVPFVPDRAWAPVELETLRVGSKMELDQSAIKVTQTALAVVYALEGTMTFEIEIGESMSYLDARKNERLYAIEWRGDEVEYYRGMNLSSEAVAQAFGLHGAFETWHKKRTAGRPAFVIFIIAFLGFISWAAFQASTQPAYTGDSSTNSVRSGSSWFRSGGWGGGK
jgi:hypothetical protein